MSVRFKVMERGQPGVVGGGDKQFYATAVTNGDMDIEALTAAISKKCTVTGADIRAVLYALVDVSVDGLSRGAIVRMGELGSFRVSISAEGRPTAREVNAASIRKASILFNPGKKMKQMLQNLKYTKVS